MLRQRLQGNDSERFLVRCRNQDGRRDARLTSVLSRCVQWPTIYHGWKCGQCSLSPIYRRRVIGHNDPRSGLSPIVLFRLAATRQRVSVPHLHCIIVQQRFAGPIAMSGHQLTRRIYALRSVAPGATGARSKGEAIPATVANGHTTSGQTVVDPLPSLCKCDRPTAVRPLRTVEIR